MAILVECPQCRARNSLRRDTCLKCGFSVKKAANKVYWVDYYDQDGRRRRERIGPSKMAAEARWAEIRRLKAEAEQIPSKKAALIRFSDFWEKTYYPWVLQNNSPSWAERKRFIYEAHLRPYFGDLTLREITSSVIEDYKNTRLSEGAAPGTVNRELAVLKHAFSLAQKRGVYTKENPVKSVTMFQENKDRWRFLTREEAQRLLDATPPATRPIFEFLLATGLRLGNVLNLRWDQVDLKRGTIRIPASSTKAKKELILPLSDWALDVLRGHPRHISSPYVFCKSSGRPYKDVRTGFKRALKRAGLDPSIRIHDLRHTFASWAIQDGVDLALLKELLGHSTLVMVLRYAHLDTKTLREGLQKIRFPATAGGHLYGHLPKNNKKREG